MLASHIRLAASSNARRFGSAAALHLVLLAFVVPPTEAQIPRGVFSLKGAGSHALPGVLANVDVLGLSVRQDWSQLEPTEGNFQWDFLDTEVAAAAANNKIVFLRINTQAKKPAWVTQAVQDAGGTFFTFNDSGVVTSIPVFWDPTYLAKKKNLIAALGAHFANNPTIKIVSASFANATSEDWNVPHGIDEVTNWLAAGYTTEKLVDAGQQIIDATMTAFPNQYVVVAIGANGHSTDRANLDQTATEAAVATVSAARSNWPGRFIAQLNTFATFNPAPPGPLDSDWNVLWNSRPDIGGQMLGNVWNDPDCRVNGGCTGVPPDQVLTAAVNKAASYQTNYLEIYEVDVRNLKSVITYARQTLEAIPTPTPGPESTPISFQFDGAADFPGYLQNGDGTGLWAAVRGNLLYVATASPGSSGTQPADHFVFVTDQLLASATAPAPWAKSGLVAVDPIKPMLGGESLSGLCSWFNAPLDAIATKSPGTDGDMEGVIDLAGTFGALPPAIYLAAAGYGTSDGGTLISQSPAGNGDGNLDPSEFLSLFPATLRDQNADGVYDRVDPALDFTAQISRQMNVTTITWNSVPGRTYQLETCDDLNATVWSSLGDPMVAGPTALTLSANDSTDLLSRFYRVRLITP